MRKILIIGAGKSASFLVRDFLDKSISEKLDITIGDLDLSNAEKWIVNNPNAHTLKLNIFEEEALLLILNLNSPLVLKNLKASILEQILT